MAQTVSSMTGSTAQLDLRCAHMKSSSTSRLLEPGALLQRQFQGSPQDPPAAFSGTPVVEKSSVFPRRGAKQGLSRRSLCTRAVISIEKAPARSAKNKALDSNVQIEAIGYYTPRKTVSNEDSIQMAIEASSDAVNTAHLSKLLTKLYRNLGSVSRQWPEDPEKDLPVDWLRKAFSQALDTAGWERGDIDVLIHTGIVRGVAEPSAAAVYSNILGTTHAQTFDIVDACNSWILGAQLANSMIKTGTARRVALISTISGAVPYLEGSYKMSSLAQVGYKVAGMTVGSAASVSFIGGGHEQDWDLRVTRVHDADKVALCMISEPDITKCLGLDEIVPGEIKKEYFGEADGSSQFYSYGSQLFALQESWFRDVLRKALDGETEADVGDVLLTHSATERQYNVFTADLGLADRHFNIHARNGNLADNTAPVALSQAIQEGRVKEGMRVSYVGQASGASTALATFSLPKLPGLGRHEN